MIVADPKPIHEIASSVAAYRTVHVLGCGACVTVCRAGGRAEAQDLARSLSHPRLYEAAPPDFTVDAIDRQCERDLVQAYLAIPLGTEAILSLGCGCGVQVLADAFDPLPVVPALSTTFMGGSDEPGVWREKCSGCGDCLLASTAAVCPVTRCAKSILNGPCGGSSEGRCEVDEETPCAWDLIYQRLKRQGRLHLMTELRPPRSWVSSGHGGPRIRRRSGTAGSPGEK